MTDTQQLKHRGF